ncbi:hypothetical protein RJ639_019090, partial [Escallonia herrerae]
MPKRDTTHKQQQITTLRRSPRLIQHNRTEPEDPETPNLKFRCIHPPSSFSSFRSTAKPSFKKTHKHYPQEVAHKVHEPNTRSKCGVKSSTASRRSPRFSEKVSPIESKQRNLLNVSKRVTRGSDWRNVDANGEEIGCAKSNALAKRVSDRGDFSDLRAKLGVNLGIMEKRVTRNSTRGSAKINYNEDTKSDCECSGFSDEGGLLEDEKGRGKSEMRRADRTAEGERARIEGIKGGERFGVKKKRNQTGEDHGNVGGWTKDQELALQKAYFAAKPTPHFWKRVARLVPGKSAQDCFDKIHSDQLTPLQPKRRSRTRGTNSSSPSLSASKLLYPTHPKMKRPSYSKRKSHQAQKTVRKLLEKQSHVDLDYEADLFSVLEPTLPFQRGVMLSTPGRDKEKPEFLQRCQERSFSAHRKHLSRFSSAGGATLASPPVLKQVKNKALHEKYIDQLHCREAKRKEASLRAAKPSRGKENQKETLVQKRDAIEAAKSALIFNARDAVNQFQHLQANSMSSITDDDGVDSDEDNKEE